jgi:hypothetical protein
MLKISLLICSLFAFFMPSLVVADSIKANYTLAGYEKGTAIGTGPSKASAHQKARKNIPGGATQAGATKYVKNGDRSYTAHIPWRKKK